VFLLFLRPAVSTVSIACVAGGISHASAFVWQRSRECDCESDDRTGEESRFFLTMRSPVHANLGLVESTETTIKC